MHATRTGIFVLALVAFAGISGLMIPFTHTGSEGFIVAPSTRANSEETPVFVAVWFKSAVLSRGLCENAIHHAKIESKFSCYAAPVEVTVHAGKKGLAKGSLREREDRPHASVSCYALNEESTVLRERIANVLVGKEQSTTKWTLRKVNGVNVPHCSILNT